MSIYHQQTCVRGLDTGESKGASTRDRVRAAGMGLVRAAVLAMLPMAASAGPDGTVFGDWIAHCGDFGADQPACRLVQTLSGADGTLIARLIVIPMPGGGALLAAQVPAGVHFPSGARFRADWSPEEETRQMEWQLCSPDLCEALALLDPDQVGDIAAAGAMFFGYRMSPRTDPVVLKVRTSGLAEGLAALANAR